MPILLRLQGANANQLPAISSCSVLLAAPGIAELILPQASPAGLMENAPLSIARRRLILHIRFHPRDEAIIMRSRLRELMSSSRLSVIAKVILATVVTLPQFNSVYGELMQIICQQLAPGRSFLLDTRHRYPGR
jgi:hypothetical protein